MATFTRQDIEEGLQRLGEIAQTKDLQIELTLVGGAVMTLFFNARPSTRNVDAVILLPREARLVREMAKQIAEERDWPEDWLNDGAKGLCSGHQRWTNHFSSARDHSPRSSHGTVAGDETFRMA